MEFLRGCSHDRMRVPGCLGHFLAGVTSVPYDVGVGVRGEAQRDPQEDQVELIDAEELEWLLRYHPLQTELRGFFYGGDEPNEPRVAFLPEICEICQAQEVNAGNEV